MTLLPISAAVAALELDQVLFAQTSLSRPLVVGTLLGAAAGRSGAGFVTGACFEYLSLADLPVGGNLTWSATIATAVALSVQAGGASMPFSFAAGLLAGWLHSRIESVERAKRVFVMDRIESAVRKDGAPCYGRAMTLSLTAHALWTFAFLVTFVSVSSYAGANLWTHAPSSVDAGLGFAATCAPWLGLSSLAVWGYQRA